MFRKILLLDILFLLILVAPTSYGQLLIVNGYILNSNSGEKMKNVSVFEKNTKIGTISNEEGYFQLVLPSGDIDITFTDNSFFPQETQLELVSDTVINVQMNLLKAPKNQPNKQNILLDKQTASLGFLKNNKKQNAIN